MVSPERASMLFLILATLGLVIACSSRNDPRLSAGEIATPTPVQGQPTATPTPGALQDQTASDESSVFGFEYTNEGNPIRIAAWEHSQIDLINQLVGYILVQGYVYDIELVDLTKPEAASGLETGSVDIILAISKTEFSDWYNRVTSSGEVLDIGSLYGDSSNDRVVAHSSLMDRLPESVDIISRIQPGEEILNDLAGRIKGGRLGLKSNVAVQIYFKQHEDQWSQWLTAEAYAGVKSAIETGRTGLFRKCLQGNGPNVFYCK